MTGTEQRESELKLRARTGLHILALLALIAALLWGSDALARVGAQSLIARAIQRDTNSALRPGVHVHGAFFLPQVVNGRYDHVQISVGPLQEGALRIAGLDADLYGVYLPLHDLMTRQVHRLVIDHSSERAVLLYTDIDAYLKALGTPVTISPAANGQLRVTGTVKILGGSVAASADVRPAFDGNVLELTPTSLDTGVPGLDDASRILLGQRLTLRIPFTALPFGQTIRKVDILKAGIVLFATGHAIEIDNG